MEKELLIVKNTTEEGPGLLEDLLIERGIIYRIVDLQKGESFPSVENYKAVVVLGGPDSANDENRKMAIELERIRETLVAGIPYLGICLGLQTLVKAAGGKVIKSPLKEVGFRDPEGDYFTVELTPEGMHDKLFKDLGPLMRVFHLHGETVDLTAQMTLLGAGKFCHNQIVKIGDNAYGLQCHFELTELLFETWISEDSDLLQLDSNALRADLQAINAAYTQTGRQLFINFLEIAGYES